MTSAVKISNVPNKAIINFDKTKVLRACRLSNMAYMDPQQLRSSVLPEGAIDWPALHDGCNAFVTHTIKAQVWRFDDDQSIWIAFRGSAGLEDVMDNIKCMRTRVRLPNHPQFDNLYVHSGFAEQFTSIQGSLEVDILRRLASRGTVKDLYFCGHSMGSATTDIAAIYFGSLLKDRVRVHTIGFGGPRFGAGLDLEAAYEACIATHARVVNEDDIVPSLPPPPFNLRHATEAIWLHEGCPITRNNDSAANFVDRARCGVWQMTRPLKFLEDHNMDAYLENIDRY